MEGQLLVATEEEAIDDRGGGRDDGGAEETVMVGRVGGEVRLREHRRREVKDCYCGISNYYWDILVF